MTEQPKPEIAAEDAEWRVSSRRSFVERRFYVDYVSNKRWGLLELVAENLLQSEAEEMVAEHNAKLT